MEALLQWRSQREFATTPLPEQMLAVQPSPYGPAELDALAAHCTQQEDAAQKVERRVRESEAALFLRSRIGQHFEAIVTGCSANDTWVRVLSLPVEGKLVTRATDIEVGRRLGVQRVATDVGRGFIDFAQAG